MSKYLHNRFIDALLTTVILFMFASVVYKLLIHYEYWLENALLFSVGWGLGHYIRKSLETSSEEVLEQKLLIILVVPTLTAFISGVVLNLQSWNNVVLRFSINFAISLLMF